MQNKDTTKNNKTVALKIVELRNIAKFYGEKLIFRGLSLELYPSSIILLLGPNGSGKSTLLKIIAGLIKPASGQINNKKDILISYLGHQTFLYPSLTALQNLSFWAKINKISVDEKYLLNLLNKVNLANHAHDQARIFSRGMAQRLNFARSILSEPDLLLLDEPFTGMDKKSQELLRSELTRLKDRGASIILVSHSEQTDAQLADHIFLLQNHKLNFAGTPFEYFQNFIQNSTC